MEQETNNIEITEEEIIAEVMKILSHDEISDNEITIKMFMEQTGMSERPSYSVLNRQVKAGVLKVRKVNLDGHVVNAYSPALAGGWVEVLTKLKE